MTGLNKATAGASIPGGAGTGINLDAWGRQKTVTDKSLFSGMFTQGIPSNLWYESLNGTELTAFSNATSVNGKLSLLAGATLNDVTLLRTFRCPRYEANRGINYATSIILPDPTAAGKRDFGFFTGESGVFFRLKSDGNLYACIETTINGVPQESHEELITIPFTLDLSKGFIADIQGQWRGVGNYTFWLGNPATGVSQKVHTINFMNTSTELSIYNPATPVAFRCENLGDNVEICCGCVDLSSEGGAADNNQYNSVSITNESGQIAISGFNTAVLAVRSKLLFSSRINTRDVLAFAAVPYADQRSFFRVWATRDATAITLNDQTWTDVGDGHLEFVQYNYEGDGTALVGTPFTFDTTKALNTFGMRVDIDNSEPTFAPVGDGKIWQSPGDIFIFTMHRENGGASNAGVTYEFLETI